MKVRTTSEQLRTLRRGVMELYISDHPLDCLTCSGQRQLRIPGRRPAIGVRAGALRL